MGEEMTEETGIDNLSDEEAKAKLAEMQASLDALKEEKDNTEQRLEEAEAGLERLASLEAALGKEPDAEDTVEERIASLEGNLTDALKEKEEAEERIAALEQKQKEREAESWAEENLAGRVPTEKWGAWKDRYMADPEGTKDLVASLPKGLLDGEDANADALPEEDSAAMDEQIDAALGIGETEVEA